MRAHFPMTFISLFLYTSTPSTPGLSRLSRCASPACRNQSDNASLMRYQAGAIRAGTIGALDKHDNKESRQVRLRWRVESTMTESIADVESRASGRSTCRTSSGPNPLYWPRRQSPPVHRRVIEGCMRGRKQGNVKPARGQRLTGVGTEN